MSQDSVALDLVFIQVPETQRHVIPDLWQHVDEQSIELRVRERLHQHGFRAGLVGTTVPRTLERLLGDQLGPSAQADPTIVETLEPREIGVRMRHQQLRANKRSENVVSGVQAEWPMLVRAGNEVSGKTFLQAQGILALRVKPLGDSRATFELTPELHHGEPRRRYEPGEEGSWLLDSGRAREIFDDMQIVATLARGEMLLVGAQQDMPGSLGQRFFMLGDATSVSVPGERLFLIRLAQTQRDNRFDDLLTVDENDTAELPTAEIVEETPDDALLARP
ncbi:MAG: hypothetical protein KF708_12405 [Pirellulales bacterium]|nr:hypothetical protein [Pirellulales bacterium]